MNYGIRTYVTLSQYDSDGKVVRRVAVECFGTEEARKCLDQCRESVPGARYVRMNRSLRIAEGVEVLSYDEFVRNML